MPLLTYTPPTDRIVHETEVDFITRDNYGRTVYLVQTIDDKLPIIAVSLYQNGVPYVIPENAEGNVRWKKPDPDRHYVYNPLLGVDPSRTVAYIEVTDQMVVTAGRPKAIIEISVNGDVSGSERIPVIIEKNPMSQADLESSDEMKSLQEYVDQANRAKTEAMESANTASSLAAGVQENAKKAAESASTASERAANASAYANAAKDSETSAGDSAAAAAKSAADGSEYATAAQSYAVGDTGSREGEEVDNAKYYYEQAKRISQGLAGALLPMGTVSFEQLASQSKQAGYMYNISDAFTTDDTFREGEGHAYPAGTNVYYTAEGEWDCLAGAQVVSVNGKTGAVTLSAEDVGAPTMKDSEFDWAALEGSTPSGNMGGLYWNKGKFLYAGCRDERGEEQWSGQLYGEMNPPPGLDDQRLLAEAADDRLVSATIYNLDNAADYAIMGGYAPDGAKVTFAFNRGEKCVYAAAVDNTGHQQWNQCLYSNGNPQPSVEKLSTPRNINGVAFDGSADINVPAVKQIVFVSGGIANAIGGVYEGAGAALVTEYVGGLAKIDFTITTTVEDSTESPACYRWGLNRDLLASKGAPMIEPANGGILQIFDLSQDGGRLQTGLTDLSGSVTPNSPFWVPARVYKTDGAVGTWQSSIMKTRWVIIGTVYGTVI